MKKNRIFTLSVLSFFALILVVSGVSYGMYIFIGTGQKENTISTGSLSVDYPDTDIIKLNTNSIGEENAKELKFSVKANFDTPTTLFYDITLDQVTATKEILDVNDIRYTLTKINYLPEINTFVEEKSETQSLNSKNNYVIGNDKFITSGETEYVLKVWIDDNYKLPIENAIGECSFKIRAIATQK